MHVDDDNTIIIIGMARSSDGVYSSVSGFILGAHISLAKLKDATIIFVRMQFGGHLVLFRCGTI